MGKSSLEALIHVIQFFVITFTFTFFPSGEIQAEEKKKTLFCHAHLFRYELFTKLD